MERLGGVYRQAVLGIADLMRERTTLRNEYRMVHTAVQPEGNNPFKWVPPQRIAVELLREEDGGYTTGERALNDALHDVKAHLLCTLAGMRAALSATFDALAPAQAEARLGGRGYLMAVQRDAALWGEYVSLAESLRLEAEDNPDGLINRAFRHGYEEQAAEIGRGTGSWR
jgi:type VI secretion system protein ImpI